MWVSPQAALLEKCTRAETSPERVGRNVISQWSHSHTNIYWCRQGPGARSMFLNTICSVFYILTFFIFFAFFAFFHIFRHFWHLRIFHFLRCLDIFYFFDKFSPCGMEPEHESTSLYHVSLRIIDTYIYARFCQLFTNSFGNFLTTFSGTSFDRPHYP